MNMLEIYEALRQITFAKARILQDVTQSHYSSEKQITHREQYQKYESLKLEISQKKKQLESSKQIIRETQSNLMQGLTTLKKQEQQIRSLKNRKVQERMDLMRKKKQLDLRLEQLKFQSDIRSCQHRRPEKVRQLGPDKDEVLPIKLESSFKELEKQSLKKEKELELLCREVDEEQEVVNQVFQAYQKLQESLEAKREGINQLKNKLKTYEFDIEKLKITYAKLSKQAMITARQEHCRNIQAKITTLTQAKESLTEMYHNYIQNSEKYIDKMQKIKQELKSLT